jgi:hypothetical protein
VARVLNSATPSFVSSTSTGKSARGESWLGFHCHSNLVRAVLPYGLTEFDVHDVLNVFQVTGLNDDDCYYIKASPARRGDFFEFFAESNGCGCLGGVSRLRSVGTGWRAPYPECGRPRPGRLVSGRGCDLRGLATVSARSR